VKCGLFGRQEWFEEVLRLWCEGFLLHGILPPKLKILMLSVFSVQKVTQLLPDQGFVSGLGTGERNEWRTEAGTGGRPIGVEYAILRLVGCFLRLDQRLLGNFSRRDGRVHARPVQKAFRALCAMLTRLPALRRSAGTAVLVMRGTWRCRKEAELQLSAVPYSSVCE
jgi:hypothetical protein